MSEKAERNKRNRTGTATIELALLLPLLLLIALGAVDFGRVFYMGVEVANAARAGVQYGAQDLGHSTDYTGMQTAALNDGKDIPGMSATASRWCQCAGGTPTSCAASYCGAASVPAVYVQVNTSATFNTLMKYPGVPSTVTLNKQAIMRVQ
jgi:Flp pilus assembly protein TadG